MRHSRVPQARERIRLYVEAPLAHGAAVDLSAVQARYLDAVRRLMVGESVLVFNGRDGEWRASLATLGHGNGKLAVDEQTRGQSGATDLWLLQALIKRGPMELVIEKAAELGAACIQLVTTEYSQRRGANMRRLRTIAIAAAEQCGRLDIPVIAEAVSLPDILADWPQGRRLIHCDESRAGPPMNEALAAASAPAAILIGPEGGFSPDEQAALAATTFATPVSLGPRILRAETAALAALTLWQALAGDWRA